MAALVSVPPSGTTASVLRQEVNNTALNGSTIYTGDNTACVVVPFLSAVVPLATRKTARVKLGKGGLRNSKRFERGKAWVGDKNTQQMERNTPRAKAMKPRAHME